MTVLLLGAVVAFALLSLRNQPASAELTATGTTTSVLASCWERAPPN